MPLLRGGYPPNDPMYLLRGATPADASKAARANMGRFIASDTAALTTQVLTTVALPLNAGDLVTKLAFKSGATAAGTPTNYWFALYDTAGALIAQTADQTTTAWAADTTKDLALSTPYLVTKPGVYYAGIMVKASTVPSLVGVTLARAALSTGFLSTDVVLSQTSGTGLTDTAPATIGTVTAIAAVPKVLAH